MATEGGFYWDESYTAAAAMTDYQYHVAKGSGADGATVSAASTDTPIGVIQNKAPSGGAMAVRHLGISKLTVDAASTNIAAWDKIGLGSTNGHGYQVTADKAMYFALALEAATANDVEITALIIPVSYISAT